MLQPWVGHIAKVRSALTVSLIRPPPANTQRQINRPAPRGGDFRRLHCRKHQIISKLAIPIPRTAPVQQLPRDIKVVMRHRRLQPRTGTADKQSKDWRHAGQIGDETRRHRNLRPLPAVTCPRHRERRTDEIDILIILPIDQRLPCAQQHQVAPLGGARHAHLVVRIGIVMGVGQAGKTLHHFPLGVRGVRR